jgi:transposase
MPTAREKLEIRRKAAGADLLAGKSVAIVARKYKVSAISAGRWRDKVLQGGLAALTKTKAHGRPPKLSHEQLEVLRGAIDRPTHWTSEAASAFIFQQFGVRFHVDHVWRLLSQMREK